MSTLAKTDIPAILHGLRDSYSILSCLVESIPEEAMYSKRGETFWTIAEHVAHLAEVQPMALERLNLMLEEDNPQFSPYSPSDNTNENSASFLTVQEALSEFKRGRDAIVTRLSTASPTDWKRTAIHPKYNIYDIHTSARHNLMHDHWHMYRMEELWRLRDDYLSKLRR